MSSDKLFLQVDDSLPPVGKHTVSSLANRTGTWRSVRPVYARGTAPCHRACPAGEGIPDYLRMALDGDWEAAWSDIRENNPFPAICGRVCYHPCEGSCNRAEYDEAVGINSLERVVGDWGLAHARTPRAGTDTGSRVAVVGAGPAGLTCAFYLAKQGVRVTILEREREPGGMLRWAIPEYRLPRTVLNGEVALALSPLISIEYGRSFSSESSLDGLFAEGFDAVFLAIGAQLSVRPNIAGPDKRGVYDALSWLRQVNSGAASRMRGTVAVVGGGNVAIDAARCALRLGADRVAIVYRRSREEMPAHETEIEAALAEGVELRLLESPLQIIGGDSVAALRCVRNELGAPDASGRREPRPITGSEFLFEADAIILATGQRTDTDLLKGLGLDVSSTGNLVVDPATQVTSRERVFAGGDATTGPARVVDAIAAGRRAALAIGKLLRGDTSVSAESEGRLIGFRDLNTAYFEHKTRQRAGELDRAQRLAGFSEVTGSLSQDQAIEEMERCFSCGHCNACDNCWLFCPDISVKRREGDYSFDYEYCKGCGICVQECPRSCITLAEEPK